MRCHDQFHTALDDLDGRGIKGERPVVLINEADLAAEGLAPRAVVDETSSWRGHTRVARKFVALPNDVPRGCLTAYYPETNVLVPLDCVADGSNQPTSKSAVTLAPAA